MKTCRICGYEKENQMFYKPKYFGRYSNADKIWCRDCMKMFMEMKKLERQQEELKNTSAIFTVSFN